MLTPLTPLTPENHRETRNGDDIVAPPRIGASAPFR